MTILNKDEFIENQIITDYSEFDIVKDTYNKFTLEEKQAWDKYRKLQQKLIGLKLVFWKVMEKEITKVEDGFKSVTGKPLVKISYNNINMQKFMCKNKIEQKKLAIEIDKILERFDYCLENS